MSEREVTSGKNMIALCEELDEQGRAIVLAFAQGVAAATVSREQKEGENAHG